MACFDEPLGVNFYFVHFPVRVVLGQGYLDKLYCLVRWDGNVEDLLSVVSHFDNPGRFRRNDAVVDYGARAEVDAEDAHGSAWVGKPGYHPKPVDVVETA